MSNERIDLLNKINNLIEKRKIELLHRMPFIHEIDDGIVIRFFSDWGECEFHDGVKIKKIINEDDLVDVTIFYFIPKGISFNSTEYKNIHNLICMYGSINLNINDKTTTITGGKKLLINNNHFTATAIEDTYILTLSK